MTPLGILETIERARAFLARNRRVSLRVLQREFGLDDDGLDELVGELVDVQQVAALEGKVLSWIGPARDEVSGNREGVQATAPDRAAAGVLGVTETGERRQLTVLFCDLVGSTELSSRMDPEDWQAVLRDYQNRAGEVIARHGGHVAQYLGDGLLVYFGWPRTYDDSAERAVRAGLGLVGAAADAEAGGMPLAVRVGLHTGPVVVSALGGEGRSETLALGDAPNVAARVQAAADAGTVLITAATQRLVPGLFVIEERGAQALKGVSAPVVLYRVVQPSGVRSRLETSVGHLTPFVGRQTELGALRDAWERVVEGAGQTVLVQGEAGLGKSRLCYELRAQLAGERHTWLECRCSPYTAGTAFHPVIELVEQALAFQPIDTPAQRLAKLEGGLRRAGFPLDETVPLLAEWLGLPPSAGYTPPATSADAKRHATLETLVAWNLRLAALQPLVVLVEDLHWCDPSSLELFGRLLAQSATERVFLIGTSRPEFVNLWPARSNHQTLTLGRLTRRQARELVEAVSQARTLPETMIEQLVARADGVPLFAEELTRSVAEAEVGSTGIPSTLQDSLLARLDRLSSAKEVAQRASVLGREFSYRLLAAVTDFDEAVLREGLARLVESELLFARGEPPEATYTFKHALVQEAAYESLLKRTRQQLHGRVVDALAADAAVEPELVARHAEAAGRTDDAIAGYERAGEQARARSAYEEAIRHHRQAIALLAAQPAGRERDAREAALQIELSNSCAATLGYACPEVEAACERARALYDAVGDAYGLGWALSGLATFSYNAGHVERAEVLAAQVCAIARDVGDAALLHRGQLSLGIAGGYRGVFASSLAHLEAALRSYEPGRHHVVMDAGSTGDRDVGTLAWSSWDLWLLGRPDRALARAREAVALARRIGHPFSLAHALCFETVTHHFRRDPASQLERASEAIALSGAHEFPFWLGVARTCEAAARVASGEREAVADLAAGLAGAGATGTRGAAPGLISIVAATQLLAGQFDEARGTVEGALALAAQTGQHFVDSELHRLKGEIELAAGGAVADAEAHFRRALEIARAQEARSFELRATTSLARLWHGAGRRTEAHDLLAPVHAWFTEGFDTRDLIEAKSLLAELP
jgi:class 3 adenylate cyclase/tetratricopeptide (TPR) repeat protein